MATINILAFSNIVVINNFLKMKKRKKKNGNFSLAQEARRKNEIEQHGKLISLRPSIVHKSKKIYSRKGMKKELSNQIGNS